MRTFFVVLVLFVSSLAHAGELTIATFNAEFLVRSKVHAKFNLPLELPDSARAQWEAPGFRDQKFTEAAAAVADVLAAINAGIVVLVEVGDERDVAEIKTAVAAKGVAYDHSAVCACSDSFTQQHVAVLSKFPLLSVLKAIPGQEGYHTELDDPDSEEETGVSKGIRVGFQFENRMFQLYGVHLASERGGNEQDQQRIAQASIIRRQYLPALNAGENIIVAGDLNAHRGKPAERRIRGLDDMWPDLIQTGSYKYFEKEHQGTRWTYEFRGERTQIDHIMISQSIKDITKRNGIKPRVPEQTNSLASDHRPFVLTLDLR